ncbi:pre-mRNA-splicing factor cwc15 [Pyricularia oryzae Y34]|uniref:Pre-mRNA-splicing factor cwc15 n=2 Tax=Pyricularia oryzae TaxID=318829 RepID=A0AA97P4Z9_PYRO3|nr:pre-mRNA-splicing factor cwc15 [Pyricularia oryzae Y34]
MTTAHRPTFDPAKGKEALRGPAYHQRLLPAHTQLKYRKRGQGGAADADGAIDLRAELLAAEAAHASKSGNSSASIAAPSSKHSPAPNSDDEGAARQKRPLDMTTDGEEDPEAKRRRILAETRELDADDTGGSSEEEDDDDDDSDGDSDDSDDEDAELARELEKIRRERAEKREREEREKAAAAEEERERDIALGNPLLNKPDFNIKRRWDDDVVFKNQARGTEDKGKRKEFINDLLRSDFHKRFMGKYSVSCPDWVV